MKKNNLKKVFIVMMLMSLMMTFTPFMAMAAEPPAPDVTIEDEVKHPAAEENYNTNNNENTNQDKNDEKTDDTKLNGASEEVVNSLSRRDKRVAELTDKYNDKFYAEVAYWLEVAQKYSLPICFIGITIGSFNYLIVGNKKLDKKEQGYGWIVAFVIGLVVFNVLPLMFAIAVAGR